MKSAEHVDTFNVGLHAASAGCCLVANSCLHSSEWTMLLMASLQAVHSCIQPGSWMASYNITSWPWKSMLSSASDILIPALVLAAAVLAWLLLLLQTLLPAGAQQQLHAVFLLWP